MMFNKIKSIINEIKSDYNQKIVDKDFFIYLSCKPSDTIADMRFLNSIEIALSIRKIDIYLNRNANINRFFKEDQEYKNGAILLFDWIKSNKETTKIDYILNIFNKIMKKIELNEINPKTGQPIKEILLEKVHRLSIENTNLGMFINNIILNDKLQREVPIQLTSTKRIKI